MAISPADIVALRQKIEADKKKLEERERAVAIVAEMLQEQHDPESGQLDLVGHAPITQQNQRTFTQATRDAVANFGQEEFTVSDVENLLKSQGVPLSGKPRPRISMILHNLEKGGQLNCVVRGTGNTPHRYRVAPR